LLEVSGVCRIPANEYYSASSLSQHFRIFTRVAAQVFAASHRAITVSLIVPYCTLPSVGYLNTERLREFIVLKNVLLTRLASLFMRLLNVSWMPIIGILADSRNRQGGAGPRWNAVLLLVTERHLLPVLPVPNTARNFYMTDVTCSTTAYNHLDRADSKLALGGHRCSCISRYWRGCCTWPCLFCAFCPNCQVGWGVCGVCVGTFGSVHFHSVT
jgi:hypothetical protein